jgi:hypothetical protein
MTLLLDETPKDLIMETFKNLIATKYNDQKNNDSLDNNSIFEQEDFEYQDENFSKFPILNKRLLADDCE